MRVDMIHCNGVHTQVMTEGPGVEDLSEESEKHIVVIIPGNPGIPEFYKGFIKSLKSKLPSNTPVWIIGHAGHVQPSNDLSPIMSGDTTWDEHYGLNAQLEHKREFINKYVPEDAHLHLIGHSIGTWMIMHLLKDDSISKKVLKCYMLFPTIEYIADTPNGLFFTRIVQRAASLLVFLLWVFSFFPYFFQVLFIQVIGSFFGVPQKSTKPVVELLKPRVLKRVLQLGKEEMKVVREAPHDVLSAHTDKLWFYYGSIDGWTPIKFYKNLKNRYPNMEAQLCQHRFYHSFVLQHDHEMGQIVGDKINKTISAC